MHFKAILCCCLLSAALVFSFQNAGAKTPPESKDLARNILLQCPWPATSVSNETDLEAKILARESVGNRVLKILRDDKLLFSFNPGFGLYPRSLFVLNDGNLATVWITGIFSHVHLFVFTYSNDKVHLALHAESNSLDPELVYQFKGDILESERKQSRFVPYMQRIIVPHVEWVRKKGNSDIDKQPVSADIYTWNRTTGKYSVCRKVPWSKRLQAL
jgi:hypothetical protein